jgi:ABC-2 type transport system permease protein
MRGVVTIALYALQEATRRRVFLVVLVLTGAFLFLYRLGARKAFEEARGIEGPVEVGVDVDTVTGATLFGLAMFATFFLGAILAVFLTLGALRGDAERGLLQPLVVRPISRAALLAGRLLAAGAVCALYVLAVYGATLVLTERAGGWRPDEIVRPGLQLAAGVVIVAALSLLGSAFLSPIANGIGVLMIFGAGLVAGLLGQIGEALRSETLLTVSERTAWALPFEALYQDGLARITSRTGGLTRFAIDLGPFGGAQSGGRWLPLWAVAYLLAVFGAAAAAFARRDL